MASELYVETLKGLTSGANANKVIIPSGQTLDISGSWSPPAGTVLQVINVVDGTERTTTSTSYVDTQLSASITPSSTSSKVLVTIAHNGLWREGSSTVRADMILADGNGSQIIMLDNEIGDDSSNNGAGNHVGCTYLLSPATTSEITYKTMIKCASSGPTWYWNVSSSRSFMTLMEIAG